SILIVIGVFLCFFFSSRRRHTRSKRDWSSDVCSSDLDYLQQHGVQIADPHPVLLQVIGEILRHALGEGGDEHALVLLLPQPDLEIGRASCRERVEMSVVAVSREKTEDHYKAITA